MGMAGAGAAAAADKPLVSPCKLLTHAEAESITGLPLKAADLFTPYSCTYDSTNFDDGFTTDPTARIALDINPPPSGGTPVLSGRSDPELSQKLNVPVTVEEMGPDEAPLPSTRIAFLRGAQEASVTFMRCDTSQEGPCANKVGSTTATAVQIARLVVPRVPFVPLPGTPTPEPTSTEPTGSPSPAAVAPTTAPSSPQEDRHGRPTFVDAVPHAAEVSTDAGRIATNALLAMLLVAFIAFPAHLFNSTFEEHYDEIRGWLRLPPRKEHQPAGPASSRLLLGGLLVGSAVLYGLLDPHFGFTRESGALFVGLLVGLAALTALPTGLRASVGRRFTRPSTIRALPLALVVGGACVLVSRLAEFRPGYLYGIIATVAIAGELGARQRARSSLIAMLGLFAAALAAWLVWLPVDRAIIDGNDGWWLLAIDVALATLFVGGLEAVLVGMLPLRALDGEWLIRWNRWIWGAFYAVVMFVFVHLMLRPEAAEAKEVTQTPFYTWLGLFLGFGALSVAFWAYFELRKPTADTTTD